MANAWADMITETTVSIDQTQNKTDEAPKFDFYKEKYGESDYVLMFWNPQQPLEQWMVKDLLEGIDVKARGIRVGKTGKCYADFENEEILERVKDLDGESVGDVVITVSPVPKRADEPKRNFNEKSGSQQQLTKKSGKFQKHSGSYREKKEQQERENNQNAQNAEKSGNVQNNQGQNQGEKQETRQMNNTNQRLNNSYGQRHQNYNQNQQKRNYQNQNHQNYNQNQRRKEQKEESIELLKPLDKKPTELNASNEIKEIKEVKENTEIKEVKEIKQIEEIKEEKKEILELNESNEIKPKEIKEVKEHREHNNNSFGKRGGYHNRGRGGYSNYQNHQNHNQNHNRNHQQKDSKEIKEIKEVKENKVIDLDATQTQKEEVKTVPEDQKAASFSTKSRPYGETHNRGNRKYTNNRGRGRGGMNTPQSNWDDLNKLGGHVNEVEIKKEEDKNILLEKKEEEIESDEDEWQTVKSKGKDQKKKGKKGGK